jgi:hypothetical protein
MSLFLSDESRLASFAPEIRWLDLIARGPSGANETGVVTDADIDRWFQQTAHTSPWCNVGSAESSQSEHGVSAATAARAADWVRYAERASQWSLPAARADGAEQLPSSGIYACMTVHMAADFISSSSMLPVTAAAAATSSSSATRASSPVVGAAAATLRNGAAGATVVTGSVEALSGHRRLRLLAAMAAHSGSALKDMPRVAVPRSPPSTSSHNLAMSSVPVSEPATAATASTVAQQGCELPHPSLRSRKAIELLLCSLDLAMHVECVHSTLHCALALAHYFIYWTPRYDIATVLLRRIVDQVRACLHICSVSWPDASFSCVYRVSFALCAVRHSTLASSRRTRALVRAHLSAGLPRSRAAHSESDARARSRRSVCALALFCGRGRQDLSHPACLVGVLGGIVVIVVVVGIGIGGSSSDRVGRSDGRVCLRRRQYAVHVCGAAPATRSRVVVCGQRRGS